MKLVSVLVLSVILFSVVRPSLAVDADGKFQTRGFGTRMCREYIESNVYERPSFLHWMLGYISGVNQWKDGREDFSGGIAYDSLFLFVDNYCKKHPLENFVNAVDALLEDIAKRQPPIKKQAVPIAIPEI